MKNRMISQWLLLGVTLLSAMLYLLWRHPREHSAKLPPSETAPDRMHPALVSAPGDRAGSKSVFPGTPKPAPNVDSISPSSDKKPRNVQDWEWRQQAVSDWDALVEVILAQEDADAASQSGRIKQAFDRMHPEDRIEPLQQALILLPDHQLPVLFDILFDNRQHPDVLDAIFDDALNRPDDLKMPLMEALREDRDHPCFFEAVRILDIAGEPSF